MPKHPEPMGDKPLGKQATLLRGSKDESPIEETTKEAATAPVFIGINW